MRRRRIVLALAVAGMCAAATVVGVSPSLALASAPTAAPSAGHAPMSPKDLARAGVLGLRSARAMTTATTSPVSSAQPSNAWTITASGSQAPGAFLSNDVCVSPVDCWAVGGYPTGTSGNHTIDATTADHFNGSTWSTVRTPSIGDASLGGVTCTSDTACWAVGYVYVGGAGELLIEQYDGTAWSTVSAPAIQGFLAEVTCVSATECWAVGDQGSSTFQPLVLEYTGTQWFQVSAAAGVGSSALFYVTCPTASDCWAVGNQSVDSGPTSNYQNLVEQYNGTSWNEVSVPDGGPGGTYNELGGVACTSASNCWANGIYAPTPPNYYFQSTLLHYDGTSWSFVSSPDEGIATAPTDIACVDASNCWGIGYYYPTTQASATFAEQITGSGATIVSSANSSSYRYNALYGLACTNTPVCWAVGSSFTSTTSGATLVEQSLQPEFASAPTNVVASSTQPAQATLTWTAPSYTGTSSITSYTVFIYDSSGFVGTQSVSGSPATVTTLTNGRWYFFALSAVNGSGEGIASGQTDSVTPFSGATPPARTATASTNQYTLPNSDGATWQNIDESTLSLSISPSATSTVILSGNADLWTANAGYNQDIGIAVSVNSAPPTVVAWKESGGYAGTFSPNAAFVQTAYVMDSGSTYGVWLVWKTNKSAIGETIAAAAGPRTGFSPTSLHADVLSSSADVQTASSTRQYTLSGSDGATWHQLDATNLSFAFMPPSTAGYVLSGNADLWTATAGYNQDIGICVVQGTQVPDPCPVADVIAWKESGGFAGTFSPNAAFVQTVDQLTGGLPYTASLVWKTNVHANGVTIAAGAGPIDSLFSPTRLTAFAATGAVSAVSTQQYDLSGSNGSFVPMDSNKLAPQFTASVTGTVLVSINTDLWTSMAGYNQDIGIFASDITTSSSPTLIGWKESGGFAGTFSPNAAFLEVSFPVTAGNTYQFTVEWATNKPTSSSNVAIFAGAGPIASAFSPTRITILPTS